jgi:hypothetical protein
MLDGNATGRAATRAISAKLFQQCRLLTVAMADGAQPDHLSRADVRSLLGFRG